MAPKPEPMKVHLGRKHNGSPSGGISNARRQSMKIDGQYDRDTGAMLFQLHRYIETWVGPRCAEYEGGCAVCYMWAIYDKLAKYTQ